MSPYAPVSLLDTDLYKFTMQQAVLHHFPDVRAKYQFTHRDKDVFFTRACFTEFEGALSSFARVALSDNEKAWLKQSCPYFTAEFIDYLAAYRFKPEQLSVTFIPVSDDGEKGQLAIEADGPWVETILWEVPLMAILSEIHFRTASTDWSYDGQDENAYEKGKALLTAGCIFSEFGTRRRRSFQTQDIVISSLLRASRDFPHTGKLAGTSNVYFAMKYGVRPVGTIAHEWFMGIGALRGYEHANAKALELWEEVYPNDLLLALTDTFSTEIFYKDFTVERARHWKGLRQDSGDPFVYAPRAARMYESHGIDYREKSIIFSDALDIKKALALKQQCDELQFPCSFGIGTFLTNDFKTVSSGGKEKSRALNMVIKLAAVDGQTCVKISDDLSKNTGDKSTIVKVKQLFGLPS